MLVVITGGTGYLGAHSVAAVRRAGHQVRLLVRDPARLATALQPLGVDPADVEHVTGDISDPGAVRRAVTGADALLHAAGSYSFDSRRHATMRAANVTGTAVVLGEARKAGLDPIVHVSTFGALLPAGSAIISADAPVGRPRETYLRSKAEADSIARSHQADGAPVIITYPLATLGPYDPHVGDQVGRLRATLLGLMPMWPDGGFPIGDVRDVARLHAAVLTADSAPRRLLACGRYVSTREYRAALRAVTGRRLPSITLPAAGMLPVGRLATAAQRMVPVHIPAEYGAIYTCRIASGVQVDNTAAESLLGDPGIPLARTLTDTVRWLHRTGRLTARQAGRAAG